MKVIMSTFTDEIFVGHDLICYRPVLDDGDVLAAGSIGGTKYSHCAIVLMLILTAQFYSLACLPNSRK